MTISNADLDSAVHEGLISHETAMALRLHALNRGSGRSLVPARPDTGEAEHFRLLSGFNDVFVVVALCVLLGALTWLSLSLLSDGGAWRLSAMALTPSLTAWMLGLYFIRRRQLALPAVVLALWFALPLMLAVAGQLGTGVKGGLEQMLTASPWPGLMLVAASLLHGSFFRVPVNAALIGCGGLLVVRSFTGPFQPWHDVLLGLLLLGAAIALDASDRLRRGLRADAAFWLHLVAAPVLVAGLFGLLGKAATLGTVLGALGVYAGLVLVSLILDRRAPLVSGLAYVLSAIAMLFATQGARDSKGMALAGSAVLIASALLLLAAGWRWARTLALAPLPPRLRDWLPPA